MANTDPAPIKGQDNAYRKGLVLGLTMAEVMLLILFMLLLVLGAIVAKREETIHRQRQKIADLSTLERFISEQLRDGKSSVTVTDIVQQIQRQQKQIADLRQEVAQLRPYEQAGKQIEDIVHEIKRNGGKASAPEILKALQDRGELAKQNGNLKGQVAQLTNQIKASGRGGNEFPSCWVTPDGKTQSIFQLTFMNSGIQIHDRRLPDRVEDEAALPLGNVHFEVVQSPGAFLEQLRPLYQWSVVHNCRFYVILHSALTEAPILAVNAANSYFYPDSTIQYRPGSL